MIMELVKQPSTLDSALGSYGVGDEFSGDMTRIAGRGDHLQTVVCIPCYEGTPWASQYE